MIGVRTTAVAALVGADLRRATRDRLGLVFVLVVPFVLIAAFGSTDQAGGSTARIGVVAGTTPAADLVLEDLRTRATADVRVVASARALVDQVRAGDLTAGVDLSSTSGGVPLVIGRGDPRAALVDLDVEAALARAAGPEPADGTDPALSARREVVEGAARPEPTGFARTAPANLVLFLFLNSVASASLLIDTRRLGVLGRLRTAGVGDATVVVGQLLGRLAICAVQAAIVLVGSTLLFGVGWGPPVGVAAVVGLFSVCSAAAAVLVAAVLRSREQVLFVAPPIAIAIGMLGGCMWPLSLVAPALRTAGHATPHAWAIDALGDLGAGRSTGSALAVDLAVLAAFSTAAALAAVVVLGRQVAAER